MAEIASAYVSLMPSAKGFGKATEKAVGGEVKKSGSRVGGMLGGAIKKGALGVVGAAGGVLGTALFKGFQRLNALDQAKAKLAGLGHTTKSVNRIMDNALASVKGTAFGLDEAATVAASAVASGVKPGKDLTRTLKLVADAATIGGSSMSDMGLIFNKVAATGKVQGEVIQQLGERGIPILQLLGKQLGKTPAQVSKMASEGKIGFDTFRNAMEKGLGGAALKSGETMTGAFANMKASLGRIGANLLSGVFDKVRNGILSMTKVMSSLEPVATKIGAAIGDAFTRVGPLVGKVVAMFSGGGTKGLLGSLKTVGGEIVRNFAPLLDTIVDIGKRMLAVLGPAFTDIARIFQSQLLPAFRSFLPVAAPIANFILKVLGGAMIGVLKGVVKIVKGALTTLSGLFNVFSGLLTGDWSKMWKGIKQILGGVMKTLLGLLQVWWNGGILSLFKRGALSLVKGIWHGMWGSLKVAAREAMAGLKALIAFAFREILNFIATVPGRITGMAGKFGAAGKAIIRALVDGLKNAGHFVSGIAGNIWSAVKGMLNAGIDKINAALEFTIPLKGLPDIPVNPPDIPHLWTGARVTGPTLAMVGDGREPETVINDTMFEKAMARAIRMGSELRPRAGGGQGEDRRRPLNFYGITDPAAVAREVVRLESFAGVS